MLVRRSVVASTDGVVVAPEVVGVCRSDLKELEGRRAVRKDFGHELVGRIVAAGRRSGRAVGERVCLDPHQRVERDSGFAEAVVVRGSPRTLADALVPVDDDAPAERMIFVEPLACAAHCVGILRRRLDGPLSEARVGIVGAGIAGTLIAKTVEREGASIVLLNRSRERLRFLEARGVLDGNRLQPLDEAPGSQLDAVVVATSFAEPEVLLTAQQLIRPGGLVVLYAGTAPGDRWPGTSVDIDRLRRSQRIVLLPVGDATMTVAGSYGAESGDFHIAKRLLCGEQPLELERLVVDSVPLEELPERLRALAAESPPGKVVVRPS
jgi:threonine dehydrogenase-like Zn-dependent dehydrogenase